MKDKISFAVLSPSEDHRATIATGLAATGLIRVVADAAQPEELETTSFRPTRPLYHWPLGIALGLGTLLLLAVVLSQRTPDARLPPEQSGLVPRNPSVATGGPHA